MDQVQSPQLRDAAQFLSKLPNALRKPADTRTALARSYLESVRKDVEAFHEAMARRKDLLPTAYGEAIALTRHCIDRLELHIATGLVEQGSRWDADIYAAALARQLGGLEELERSATVKRG